MLMKADGTYYAIEGYCDTLLVSIPNLYATLNLLAYCQIWRLHMNCELFIAHVPVNLK